MIAAIFLFAIKHTIIYRDDKKGSALKMVPLYVSIMGWAFVTYLMMKGFKHLFKVGFPIAIGVGFVGGIAIFFFVQSIISKYSDRLSNSREDVNRLFTIPLIFAAPF